MSDTLDHIDYLCDECARELGGTPPENHVCTMHTGICDHCSRKRALSNVGDWNWRDGKQRGMRD